MIQDLALVHAPISAPDFNSLCRSVGWREVPSQNFEVAVKNSLRCVHAVLAGEVVGFARLVGDVGMYLYLQDLIVRRDMQGCGIGAALVNDILSSIAQFEISRFRLGLIAESGVVQFYQRLGFEESQPVSKFMVRGAGGLPDSTASVPKCLKS